jgi:hypothetical protein
MTEDAVIALNEIAKLLRRQVEQTDEGVERAAKQMAAFEARSHAVRPDFSKQMEESAAQMRRSMERAETARAEELEFRARLFATLDRQNALLEQLLTRLKA